MPGQSVNWCHQTLSYAWEEAPFRKRMIPVAVTKVLVKTLKIGDESIRMIIRLKRRLALALLLSSLAIDGAVAGSNVSRCLDPATTLDAGGDVSDKELTAARQACAHLRQQSDLDREPVLGSSRCINARRRTAAPSGVAPLNGGWCWILGDFFVRREEPEKMGNDVLASGIGVEFYWRGSHHLKTKSPLRSL